MHILLFGGPCPTSPDQVWSANPDHPIGQISTIGLDLTFDQTLCLRIFDAIWYKLIHLPFACIIDSKISPRDKGLLATIKTGFTYVFLSSYPLYESSL